MEKKRIFVVYDHDKEEYVWSETFAGLRLKSPNWVHQYRETDVSENQFKKLQNGGSIIFVSSWGSAYVKV